MTKWQPMPIRKPGQSWSGMNTRGGKTDDGQGQLTQNSVNCTINVTDTLSKRLGFVRGLNERFGTVVCGLHAYVDNCGIEWLLVASDEEIAIRQPFTIPVFTTDDSYPNDDFADTEGLSAVDWRNTSIYTATGGSLQRGVGDSLQPFDAASFLRWFKAAASLSYELTIQYEFDTNFTTEQIVSVVIKGTGDLTVGRRLQADLVFSTLGTYVVRLYKADAAGTLTEIGAIDVEGSFTNASGFLTISYTRSFVGPTATFTPNVSVVPNGGALQTLTGDLPELNELEDVELGGVSAIGCGALCSILQVTSGGV